MLIDVTAAPGREARSHEESYQELYRSHVQVVRLQTYRNLYFHQFLLYLVFKLDHLVTLLNEKQCNAMIIRRRFGGRAPLCGTESHHELLLFKTSKRTNS